MESVGPLSRNDYWTYFDFNVYWLSSQGAVSRNVRHYGNKAVMQGALYMGAVSRNNESRKSVTKGVLHVGAVSRNRMR